MCLCKTLIPGFHVQRQLVHNNPVTTALLNVALAFLVQGLGFRIHAEDV